MPDRILIQGKPYEVIEWDQRDPDTDGHGTTAWTLYARSVEDQEPDNGQAEHHDTALREELLAVRKHWADLRATHEERLKAADRTSAAIAFISRDLCIQVLRDIDTVLNATGEGR